MSDPVESFILSSSFGDGETAWEPKKDEENEFVCLFEPVPVRRDDQFDDEGNEEAEAATEEEEYEAEYAAADEPEPPEEPPVDIEAETRKIFEEAFTQGEKAGYEMGLQKVEPLAKRLARHIGELDGFKEQLVTRAHGMALDLALAFAEAVVLRRCNDCEEVVSDMVRKALDICETKSEILIRVRPDDAHHIGYEGNGFVKVVPDDSIREPGFVIETNFGDIDGRISTQIEELKRRVYE